MSLPPVGILPAAGRARRLGRLPCSKEILPVAFGPEGAVPAIGCALTAMAAAGVEGARIAIAPGKEDIPRFLGNRHAGVALSFVTVTASRGAPDSVRAALGGLEDRRVVLAFPDILFTPREAIASIVAGLNAGCEACLALVPSDRGDKVDLVQTDSAGRFTRLDMKPGAGRAGHTWVAAAWTPRFTQHLLYFHGSVSAGEETYFGEVLVSGHANGLAIGTVNHREGWALDVGTPADLLEAWRRAEEPSWAGKP